MPVAARKPQASTPNDGLILSDLIEFEDVIFETHQRFPIGMNDSLEMEDVSLLVGLSAFISLSDDLDVSNSLFHFYLNQISFNDTVDVEVYQNFTEQLIAVLAEQEIDPSDAVGRLDNLELDLARTSVNPNFFKEFSYSGESLTGYSLYTDSGKGTLLMSVVFRFSDGDLISKTIHRFSDNKTLTVTFTYSDGNLISQTRN